MIFVLRHVLLPIRITQHYVSGLCSSPFRVLLGPGNAVWERVKVDRAMLSDTLYLDNLQEFVEDEKRIVSPGLASD